MMRSTLVEASPSSTWRWFAVAMLAIGLVIGLLGMHTLSTHHAESSVTSVVTSGAHHADSAGVEAPAANPACFDCGAGSEHDVLMMACVLALLAVICLLLRPRAPLMRVDARVRGVEASLSRTSPLLMRPPSLLELSISRT